MSFDLYYNYEFLMFNFLGLGGCSNKSTKMKEVTSMREQSRGKSNVMAYYAIDLFLDVLKGRPELMKYVVNMVSCNIPLFSCVLAHH